MPRRPRRTALLLALAAALAGCGREELLHGLDEVRANEVLVALGEGGVDARQAREDGPDAALSISVPASDAPRARRLLADRALPRERAPGFAEVFAKGSMVPTPTEEHALYQHAVAGELARSLEAIDGVVGARVHLGLPPPDPLRAAEPGARATARAAVLVRCRPAACPAIRALEPGLRALVAGSADGLEPGAVAVVITEAAPAVAPPSAGGARSAVLVGLAAVAALAAAALGAMGWSARLRARGAPGGPSTHGPIAGPITAVTATAGTGSARAA